MSTELLHHLRCLSRCVYFVTEEEDRFLLRLRDLLKKYAHRTFVYNASFGLIGLDNLVKDWKNRAHAQEDKFLDIHDALIHVYRDDPKEQQSFFVFTDPERYLRDEHIVRRFLNILHQLHNDIQVIKMIIFVGQKVVIPDKLARYVEVVHDTGVTDEEITNILAQACQHLDIQPQADLTPLFRGLTSFEVGAAIAQSIVKTKKDGSGPKPKRIDPTFITNFRKRQLKKTDLVSYIDTAGFSFDDVGGADRFKKWARKTKAVWTAEGQKAGLEPPKGILAVGPWGTGKSLATRTLGGEWGLPLIQLEMGRLRSAAVGESEANVYRATRIIESVAPCIVWIDEAEKSLSGGQSSAQSDAGTGLRAIGILSTWLQETKAPVCLAMTANSLKTLPVEFVNRMDERFFFDIPSEEERIAILKIHLRQRGQDPAKYNLSMLSEKCSNMVGREIWQCIKAAQIDSFDQGKAGIDEDVLAEHLSRKPRIIKTMVDEIKEVLDWVGYDPDVDDGIRARFASEPNRSGSLKIVSG